MRFLIFNLVVAGALFYLFNDGQLPAARDNGGMLHKVTMAARNTVEAGRQATAAVVDKVMQKETVAPAPVKVPEIEVPTRTAVPPVPVQPKLATPKAPAIKPIDEPTANANLIPPVIKDPAVRQRRAEVLATGPVAGVKQRPGFMSPSQRRRELHALSEEMELLFASSRAN
ncbi:MAG: hypothetical protein QF521_12280 [Alphaproteobacteria bacterium]|jgi:hypothetical protein|nr:hypothetical protein [Alphaproteobacteria bacterium]MDP6874299.1 hypothetical protein [Alphaproteobacteria bacterium]